MIRTQIDNICFIIETAPMNNMGSVYPFACTAYNTFVDCHFPAPVAKSWSGHPMHGEIVFSSILYDSI